MGEVLEAFKVEFIKAAPALVAALVGVVIAGFAWLQKRMSLVRNEVAASAVRQAREALGDGAQAEQAAIDELHRMSPKVRPKHVVDAVIAQVNEQRRASIAPPLEPVPDDEEPPT